MNVLTFCLYLLLEAGWLASCLACHLGLILKPLDHLCGTPLVWGVFGAWGMPSFDFDTSTSVSSSVHGLRTIDFVTFR